MLTWMDLCRTLKFKTWSYTDYVSHQHKVIWTTASGLRKGTHEKKGENEFPSFPSSISIPSTASSTSSSKWTHHQPQTPLKEPPSYSQVLLVVQEEIQVEPTEQMDRATFPFDWKPTSLKPTVATGTKLSPQSDWKEGWDESAQDDLSISSLRSHTRKAEEDFQQGERVQCPDPPGSITEELKKKPLKPETMLQPPPEVDTSKKNKCVCPQWRFA